MANYLNKNELLREVILSKAKGKRSKRLDQLLILLGKGMSLRMSQWTPLNQRKDASSQALTSLFENWDKFNYHKYDNPFSYYSEIYKRAWAGEINVLNYKHRSGNQYKTSMILVDFQTFGNPKKQ